MRVCIEAGCPTLTNATRCKPHARTRDKARGSRTERGYGPAHVARRAAYQASMDAGQLYTCWRCGRPINPSSWHLGHDDTDRTTYKGPECVPCNTATRGRHISPDA